VVARPTTQLASGHQPDTMIWLLADNGSARAAKVLSAGNDGVTHNDDVVYQVFDPEATPTDPASTQSTPTSGVVLLSPEQFRVWVGERQTFVVATNIGPRLRAAMGTLANWPAGRPDCVSRGLHVMQELVGARVTQDDGAGSRDVDRLAALLGGGQFLRDRADRLQEMQPGDVTAAVIETVNRPTHAVLIARLSDWRFVQIETQAKESDQIHAFHNTQFDTRFRNSQPATPVPGSLPVVLTQTVRLLIDADNRVAAIPTDTTTTGSTPPHQPDTASSWNTQRNITLCVKI